MKTELELNELILNLTKNIRERKPELLKFLDEMPVTIPYEENPPKHLKTLASYYESLVALVEEHKNDPAKSASENSLNIPLTEIVIMEQENSYQNLMTEVNNTTISYKDVGKGDVPIVFLHGFPFDKSMWKGQIDRLKDSNRVIAIDLRGFGKSTDEKSPLSMDLFGDDLIAFLDKLNIDKAIICGLSMGGYVALNVIQRFPERFTALVLCDTQCIADSPEVREKRNETIEQINQEGADAFKEKFITSVFHPDSLVNKTELVDSLRNIVFANSKEIITAGLKALAERSETCSTLEKIRVPTLIICGRQDEVTPLAQSELMHERIRGSILKIIDNAGHVSNLEQPDEFNKHLAEFVNSLNTSL